MSNENDFTYEDWLKTVPEGYELSPEARDEIEQKIKELLATCKALGAPVFITWAVEEDKEKVTMSSAGSLGGVGRAPLELLMMTMCDKPSAVWLDHMIYMMMQVDKKAKMS